MLWNIAKPLNSRIPHRGVGVEAFGDGVADEGGAFLGEQFDELLLLGDKLVNPPRLTVQKCRNRPLLGKFGKSEPQVADDAAVEIGEPGRGVRAEHKLFATYFGIENVVNELWS